MRTLFGCLLTVIVVAAPLLADIAVTPQARKEVMVTVYHDFGVIKDVRSVDIPQGKNKIRFEGVAAGIDNQSVLLEWSAGTAVVLLEQSFEFDLVNPSKLLEKYVGKELEIVPRKGLWSDSTVRHAELISMNGNEPVFRIGTKITFGDVGQILFPYVPENLYGRPMLIWLVQSEKRQTSLVAVTYQADGLSWDADYLLCLDSLASEGNLTGRLNLTNNAGMDFTDAQFTFAADPVHRVGGTRMSAKSGSASDTGRFSLSSTGMVDAPESYQIFPVKRPLTIQDKQVKQIEWIPPTKVKVKRHYSLTFNPEKAAAGKPEITHADVILELDNTEANGLGIPLPRGVFRLYRKHTSTENSFVGEDKPVRLEMNQSIRLLVGLAPGITGLWRTSNLRNKPDRMHEISGEVVLSNHNTSDAMVEVRQAIGPEGKVLMSSDQSKPVDANMVNWMQPVKAGSSRILSFTILTRG
jgi:hypothetical protein